MSLGNSGRRMDAAWRKAISEGLKRKGRSALGVAKVAGLLTGVVGLKVGATYGAYVASKKLMDTRAGKRVKKAVKSVF